MLHVEDYINEAESKVSNTERYRKINYDSTNANNETINKVISRFQKENMLNRNISEELKTENPKTPHLYLKPKIQKRVIVGNCDNSNKLPASKISEYVDYHIQLIVKKNPIAKIQPIFLGRLTKF